MERYFDISTNVYDCRSGCYNGCCYNEKDKNWPPCISRAGESCCPCNCCVPQNYCCEQWWCWMNSHKCKSALFACLLSGAEIPVDEQVKFDTLVKKSGDAIAMNSNGSFTFAEAGYYHVDSKINVESETPQAVKLALQVEKQTAFEMEAVVARGEVTGAGLIEVKEADLAKEYTLVNLSAKEITPDTELTEKAEILFEKL